jgi:hypothetical protein
MDAGTDTDTTTTDGGVDAYGLPQTK